MLPRVVVSVLLALLLAASRSQGRLQHAAPRLRCYVSVGDSNTVHLRPLDMVTARVQFGEQHHSVELHMCGPEYCSRVWLWGVGPDGALLYQTGTKCTSPTDCRTENSKGDTSKAESSIFAPGEGVLEVEHRPGELAVWRPSNSDNVVTVPIEADYRTLQVRPHDWATAMPVEFTEWVHI